MSDVEHCHCGRIAAILHHECTYTTEGFIDTYVRVPLCETHRIRIAHIPDVDCRDRPCNENHCDWPECKEAAT